MVGKITEDADKQIIPQASAQPIRPAGTPLKGAAITAFEPNIAGNGYSLTYTLSGKTYVWDYKWDNVGNYVFNFDGPTVKSTSTFKGSTPCTVPVAVGDLQFDQMNVQIFPNPAQNELFISLDEKATAARIRKVNLLNADGKTVFESNSYQENIKTEAFPRGIYFFQMLTNEKVYIKKLILN